MQFFKHNNLLEKEKKLKCVYWEFYAELSQWLKLFFSSSLRLFKRNINAFLFFPQSVY